MKRITIAIISALGLIAAAGTAAGQQAHLAPIQVSSTRLDCTPPSDLAACRAWHAEIRRNFTPREIGMLFGGATSYPEFRTSYSWVKERYDRLQAEFAATHDVADSVASK